MTAIRIAAMVTVAALLSCAPGPDGLPSSLGEPVAIESPAGPGSGEPFLSPTRDGGVVMSWLEQRDSVHELRFSRLANGSWTAPRAIARSSIFFVNWADFPSIIELSDGRLATHWLRRSGPGRYAYDVWVAFSDDGGDTWSDPVRPHGDETETEHGFVSLFEVDGSPAAMWLDGRKTAGIDGQPGVREMTLRYARFNAAGSPVDEVLVDDRTCDCCQTDAAVTAEGPVVVYRDRSPAEVRDIAITRHIGGQWTEPVPVNNDGWVINACPVNGPAIVAAGRNVAVAWFTAAADTPRVRVAFSGDAGATFGTPLRIDAGDPLGRVDLLLVDDGSVVVAWLERLENGASVLARRVSPDGAGDITVVGSSDAGRASGFPRLVQHGERILFAWTVPGEPATIRMAAVPLE